MRNFLNKKTSILLVSSFLCLGAVFVFINRVPDVHAGVDVVDWFETVDDLKEKAELIVEIDVDSTETINYGDLLFTLSSNKVLKVFKGDKKLKSVQILETGGLGEVEIDGNKRKINLIVEHGEVLKKKEKAIVYLEKYEGGVAENCYVIIGVHQGKFKKNNITNKLTPPDEVEQFEEVTNVNDLNL